MRCKQAFQCALILCVLTGGCSKMRRENPQHVTIEDREHVLTQEDRDRAAMAARNKPLAIPAESKASEPAAK